MNKILFRLLLFVSLTLVVWFGVFSLASQSYMLEYRMFGTETNWGFVNQRSTEWRQSEKKQYDILFFGASVCYSGIDPRTLETHGLSGFNLCSSSQTIANSAELLSPAISEGIPRIIALDIHPEIWGEESPYLECAKDWIINSNLRSPKWSKAYRQMAIQSGDIFTFITTFYYDYVRKFKAAGSNPYIAEDKNGTYRGLGFVARSFAPLDSIECEDLYREMSEFECEAIADMRAQCEAAGAQLVLINPPQLCEETFEKPACFEGLTYIDGNRWPGAKTPQHFYDDHHLVEAGALSYSAWLAAEIAKLPRD